MTKNKYLFFNGYKEMIYWFEKLHLYLTEHNIGFKCDVEKYSIYVRNQKLIFAVSDR